MFITLIAKITQAICILFLVLLSPLSPIGIALLAGDVIYVRRYINTFQRHIRMLSEMTKADVIARGVATKLTRWLSPKRTKSTAPAERIVGDCTHCGKCCINKSCVFLEIDGESNSRCGIYNNWFWKQTNCGGYPISAQEIAIYDCPSYRAEGAEGAEGAEPSAAASTASHNAGTDTSTKVIALHWNSNTKRKALSATDDETHLVIPINRASSVRNHDGDSNQHDKKSESDVQENSRRTQK